MSVSISSFWTEMYLPVERQKQRQIFPIGNYVFGRRAEQKTRQSPIRSAVRCLWVEYPVKKEQADRQTFIVDFGLLVEGRSRTNSHGLVF